MRRDRWPIRRNASTSTAANIASRRRAACKAKRSGSRPLHCHFRLQACEIAVDRCHREHAAAALVAQQAILAGDAALHCDLVPFLGMADIIDADVVMLAPE